VQGGTCGRKAALHHRPVGGRPLGRPGEERTLAELRNGLSPNCRFDGTRVRLLDEETTGSSLELLVLPVCRLDVDWSEETPF